MVYSDDDYTRNRDDKKNYHNNQVEEDEEEIKRREIEQKKRLDNRIEIAEKGAQITRQVWNESPTHNHDAEIFNLDKGNEYGKLRYNLTEQEKTKEKHEKKKANKKKKKSKKSKKSKKKSKKHKSESSDESESSSESEIEAIEINIDNLKKGTNTSDEEDAEKMIIDNRRKVFI
jgi:hypothetical protein